MNVTVFITEKCFSSLKSVSIKLQPPQFFSILILGVIMLPSGGINVIITFEERVIINAVPKQKIFT